MANPVSPQLLSDTTLLENMSAALCQWAGENRESVEADNRAGLAKAILGSSTRCYEHCQVIARYVLALTTPQPTPNTAVADLLTALSTCIPTYLSDHPFV